MKIRLGGSTRAAVLTLVLVAGLAMGQSTGPLAVPSAGAAACAIGRPSADMTQRIAASPGHAQVWRQYQAFFLRQPDEQGLAYWYAVRARGTTLSQIAHGFSNSDEFRARYGDLDDNAFVTLVYRNVLCRTPIARERDYWVGGLRSSSLTRWDMVVTFAELREFLGRTGTCHSIHPAETAAVASCPKEELPPLAQASLARHGYAERAHSIGRVGGGSGSLRGVDVDVSRNLVRTSDARCSVASINANWVAEQGKDAPNPNALGIGLVDGVHVKGSADRLDRGVVGLRFDRSPVSNTEAWPGDKGTERRQRISSVLHHEGWLSIESWHATAEESPYLRMRAPEEWVDADEWVWAIAGMAFIINGQTNEAFDHDYAADPYTNQTTNHSIVAFDRESGVLFFGATSTLDTRDIVRWAEARGIEELVKFDGGGSTEYNIAGRAVVAGTPRDIPVWFGIGC